MSTVSANDLIIDEQRVVSFHYQLSNGFGEVIDSSSGGLPLVYMHNTNALLSSLERELTGHRARDEFDVTVYPEDGYGYAQDELIQEFPIASLQMTDDIIVGHRFRALGKNDEEQLVTVTEIREETVVLDANHPLAGQVLHFAIAIIDVREPTDIELAQGFATTTNPPSAGGLQ